LKEALLTIRTMMKHVEALRATHVPTNSLQLVVFLRVRLHCLLDISFEELAQADLLVW
jgi:hypothetical protein